MNCFNRPVRCKKGNKAREKEFNLLDLYGFEGELKSSAMLVGDAGHQTDPYLRENFCFSNWLMPHRQAWPQSQACLHAAERAHS